jgi:hypothetical protein
MRYMTAEVLKTAQGISMGYYSEVVSYGHTLARPGELVELHVNILSLHTDTMYIASMGQLGGRGIAPSPEYVAAEPGAITPFTYQFTMPDGSTVFEVWTYYWTGTEWYLDDHKQITIAIAGEPESQLPVWPFYIAAGFIGLGVGYAMGRRRRKT